MVESQRWFSFSITWKNSACSSEDPKFLCICVLSPQLAALSQVASGSQGLQELLSTEMHSRQQDERRKDKKYSTACFSLRELCLKFTLHLPLTSPWTPCQQEMAEAVIMSLGTLMHELKAVSVLREIERVSKWLRISTRSYARNRKRLWPSLAPFHLGWQQVKMRETTLGAFAGSLVP